MEDREGHGGRMRFPNVSCRDSHMVRFPAVALFRGPNLTAIFPTFPLNKYSPKLVGWTACSRLPNTAVESKEV